MGYERDLVFGTGVIRAVTLSHPVTIFQGRDACLAAVVHALFEECAVIVEVARIGDVNLIVVTVPPAKMHITSKQFWSCG